MTVQPRHRDDLVGAALDDLGVPAPRDMFFEQLERRLSAGQTAARRPRRWLRLAAAAAAAAVAALALGTWWANRPGAGTQGVPTAYAIAAVKPVGMVAWGSPYAGSWWFAGDSLYWLTAPEDVKDPYAKVVAHCLDLLTGSLTKDDAFTRLLRDAGFPGMLMPTESGVGRLDWAQFLPDATVILSRSVQHVQVKEHLADSDVTYWDRTRLFLSEPPYLKSTPIGPLSTWSVNAGTGGGGGGRGSIAASSEAAIWAQSGPAGEPRPLKTADERRFGTLSRFTSPAAGLWACDLATGKAVRLAGKTKRLYGGTWMVRPLPLALGSSVVWAVEDPKADLPVLSDEERVNFGHAKRVRLYAYDVQTGIRTRLPVSVTDALAGDVFVGFVPSNVRFFDRRTRELWTVPAFGEHNTVQAVAADGHLAAWVEWRSSDIEELEAGHDVVYSLVVRCCDVRTREVRTLGQVVTPPGFALGAGTCKVSVVGDRVYWTIEEQQSDANVFLKGLTVYGARVWTAGGELRSQLLQPAAK